MPVVLRPADGGLNSAMRIHLGRRALLVLKFARDDHCHNTKFHELTSSPSKINILFPDSFLATDVTIQQSQIPLLVLDIERIRASITTVCLNTLLEKEGTRDVNRVLRRQQPGP